MRTLWVGCVVLFLATPTPALRVKSQEELSTGTGPEIRIEDGRAKACEGGVCIDIPNAKAAKMPEVQQLLAAQKKEAEGAADVDLLARAADLTLGQGLALKVGSPEEYTNWTPSEVTSGMTGTAANEANAYTCLCEKWTAGEIGCNEDIAKDGREKCNISEETMPRSWDPFWVQLTKVEECSGMKARCTEGLATGADLLAYEKTYTDKIPEYLACTQIPGTAIFSSCYDSTATMTCTPEQLMVLAHGVCTMGAGCIGFSVNINNAHMYMYFDFFGNTAAGTACMTQNLKDLPGWNTVAYPDDLKVMPYNFGTNMVRAGWCDAMIGTEDENNIWCSETLLTIVPAIPAPFRPFVRQLVPAISRISVAINRALGRVARQLRLF